MCHGFLSRLLFLLLCVSVVHPFNILIWSATIGQSHVNFMGNIADVLTEDGHNVTMLMIENDPEVTNSGTRRVRHLLRYSSPLVDRGEWAQHHFKRGNVFKTKTFEMTDYFSMQSINYRICQSMLADQELVRTIRSAQFDLVVLEMFHFCPAGILHLAGVPKIMMASALGMTFAHYELLGVDTSLSYVPTFMTHMGSRMSYLDRIYNVLFYYTSKLLYLRMYYSEQALFEEKYPGFPDLAQLFTSKMDYLLLNSNQFTESTRPILLSIRHIGGATTREPLPLSQDFDYILGRGKKGAILFSLGSLVKSSEMPAQMRQAFLEAFLSFSDYEFIWKDDAVALQNRSTSNIHFRRWVPQVDLLADSRLKLFITHGGMNSLQESLQLGVPMVVMPVFADQDANAALSQERGFSVTLDKFSISREKIVDSIREVLGEEQQESPYSLRARSASRVLSGSAQLMKGEIQRLVRLSASEPDLSHLRLQRDHLSYFQYYNLDVYLLFAALPLVSLALVAKWLLYNVRIEISSTKLKSA